MPLEQIVKKINAMHYMPSSLQKIVNLRRLVEIVTEITLTPLEEKSQPQIMGPLHYVSGYF